MTLDSTTSPDASLSATNVLIDLGRWIDSRHWCPATGGNFSHRLSADQALITRSGCHKGHLTATDFLKVSIPEGTPLIETAIDTTSDTTSEKTVEGEGHNKPSAETYLHTRIYDQAPEAQVVLHTHSVNSTVLSRVTNGDWFTLSGFEMQKALTGNTTHEASVALAIFDNDQDMTRLADAVQKRWSVHPLHWGFLVRGHGLYSWGNTAEQARQHLEALEFLFACALEMRKFN